MKKAIVTGGAGFIGSHLVDALVNGGVDVCVIDKRKPKRAVKNDGARYKKMDVQSKEAFKLIKKEQPDVIFHLAAHIHDRESVREPVMNAEENILGTLNILEAARALKGARVVFASTGGVMYGDQETLPNTEQTVPNPGTPYAISKLTAEKYLAFYHTTLGIPYVALRFTNVYGPRQDSSAESGAIGIFAAALLKGEQVFINNDGETTRDYVFVSDAVKALLLAAASKETGVFNIGHGVEVSTNDLFELVREAVGVQARPDNREEVSDVVKRSALDATQAQKKLKWKPCVTLEEGIRETVSWYSEHV